MAEQKCQKERREPVRTTVLEEIAWRYAQLSMAHAMLHDNATAANAKYYSIRSREYKLVREERGIGSFYHDEKEKIGMNFCVYCHSKEQLSLDHIIPRKKLGADFPENLLPACRHCNSSKGSEDMLAWLSSHHKFPSIFLLRIYLKLIWYYCGDHGLLYSKTSELNDSDIPFDKSQMLTTMDYLYDPLRLSLTETVDMEFVP